MVDDISMMSGCGHWVATDEYPDSCCSAGSRFSVDFADIIGFLLLLCFTFLILLGFTLFL